MEVRSIVPLGPHTKDPQVVPGLDILEACWFLCRSVLFAGGGLDLSSGPYKHRGERPVPTSEVLYVVTFTRRVFIQPRARISIHAFFGMERECGEIERFASSYKKYSRWVRSLLLLLEKDLCIAVLQNGDMWRMKEFEKQKFRLHMILHLNQENDYGGIIELLSLNDKDFADRMRESL